MVSGLNNMISFLCSLIILVLRNWWLLIYLFEPSIKRHRILTITSCLFRLWLDIKLLLLSLHILVLRLAAFNSSCKTIRRGVACFHLTNWGIPWSSHENLRWSTISLVASYRWVMNVLSSKGWSNFLNLLNYRLLVLPLSCAIVAHHIWIVHCWRTTFSLEVAHAILLWLVNYFWLTRLILRFDILATLLGHRPLTVNRSISPLSIKVVLLFHLVWKELPQLHLFLSMINLHILIIWI
jgi:hypothetical protein